MVKATPKNIHYHIWSARFKEGEIPVFTVQQLADDFDVSHMTMRDRLDEVIEKPGIRQTQIGQAEVYWHDSAQQDDQVNPEDIEGITRSDLVKYRGLYFDMRGDLRDPSLDDDEAAKLSYITLKTLTDYISIADLLNVFKIPSDFLEIEEYGARDPTELRFEDEDRPQYRIDSIPKEELDYHFFMEYMFEDSNGAPIRGIWEFKLFVAGIRSELQDEHGNIDVENIVDSDARSLLPSPSEIISAGNRIDDLISRAYGMRW